MPVHLSQDGLSVLDENESVVPGGHHSSRAEARAHEQAMNINMRREEGKPVAPKLNKGIRLPNGEFDAQKRDINPDVGGGVDVDKLPNEDFVDSEGRRFPIKIAGDVMDAVHSYGRADPKIPFDRFKERLTAIARRKGFESSLPEEWKEEQKARSIVDEQDPNGYVGEEFVDAPKKSSFLVDPTEDDLYVWLTEYEDTPRWFKGSPPYVDRGMGDMLNDRAHYHHSPERYNYNPAPDWNDDTTSLPDIWVRAHPYGSTYKKDAHGEFFDGKTNFHDQLLNGVPVSYYHNYDPSGEPNGDPVAIGRTVARRYRPDGRWDKIHFDDGMPKGIKSRIANALAKGTLRASPTVVPDFHEVDQNGHIKNWLTGSIAVLDANGSRQPANPKAIGIPAMKALFKAAHIPFPKEIEKMTKSRKALSMKSLFKAFMKAISEAGQEPDEEMRHEKGRMKAEQDALYHEHKGMADGEGHSHERGDEPHEHEEGTEKALFENSNPEESASAPYGLGNTYWWERYTGPQTPRDRYDGGDPSSFQKGLVKDVQPLAQELENIMREEEAEGEGNPLKDPDIRLDWQRQQKAMSTMKAQLHALQFKADDGEFRDWFNRQLMEGKVVPSEFDEMRAGYMQALFDDRTMRPTMKSAGGKFVSRTRILQRVVEQRASKFEGHKLTAAEMKALGYQFAGFDQSEQEEKWDEDRRKQLLAVSPLGNKILQDEKKAK